MSKKVLFLCTGNSCRSQMAEGYLREMAKGSLEAFSAGLLPTAIHPLAIQVMDEDGIDISQQTPKEYSVFNGAEFDFVITLCNKAKQSCPAVVGPAKKLHWDIDDPASFDGEEKDQLAFFRKIRNDIKAQIENFMIEEAKVV